MLFSHKMQAGCETLSVLYVVKVDQMKWNKFSVAHELVLLSQCHMSVVLHSPASGDSLLAALCHGMSDPHGKALFVCRLCLQQAAVTADAKEVS